MKILDQQETKSQVVKNGFFQMTEALYEQAIKIKIGESILVEPDEWQGATVPSSNWVNKIFAKNQLPNRFKMRSLKQHKGYLFIRVK